MVHDHLPEVRYSFRLGPYTYQNTKLQICSMIGKPSPQLHGIGNTRHMVNPATHLLMKQIFGVTHKANIQYSDSCEATGETLARSLTKQICQLECNTLNGLESPLSYIVAQSIPILHNNSLCIEALSMQFSRNKVVFA